MGEERYPEAASEGRVPARPKRVRGVLVGIYEDDQGSCHGTEMG